MKGEMGSYRIQNFLNKDFKIFTFVIDKIPFNTIKNRPVVNQSTARVNLGADISIQSLTCFIIEVVHTYRQL